jgi:hypothetical protein
MQHLTLEEVARLVDEAPEPAEAEHLRSCLVCRRELDELRRVTSELADLPDPEPAPDGWEALEARLLAEGLMKTPAPVARPAARGGWRRGTWLRLAAALALFVLGGTAGALLWGGRDVSPTQVAANPPADQPEVAEPARPVGGSTGLIPEEVLIRDAAPEQAPDAGTSGARFASAGGEPRRTRGAAPRRTAPPPSAEEVRRAERELADAEGAYLAAIARYAQIADPASGADPLTRLAALERLVETTGKALERAPEDPVINGYHLAALAERDELKRQIARASQAQWF